MKRLIKLSDQITIVFSKEEFGFQEVIDDFTNAKTIRILTYNLSDKLLDLLKTIEAENKTPNIRIITNIPGRFQYYFNNYTKQNANKKIIDYMCKLP